MPVGAFASFTRPSLPKGPWRDEGRGCQLSSESGQPGSGNRPSGVRARTNRDRWPKRIAHSGRIGWRRAARTPSTARPAAIQPRCTGPEPVPRPPHSPRNSRPTVPAYGPPADVIPLDSSTAAAFGCPSASPRDGELHPSVISRIRHVNGLSEIRNGCVSFRPGDHRAPTARPKPVPRPGPTARGPPSRRWPAGPPAGRPG